MKNDKINAQLVNITMLMLLLYITFSNVNLWWNLLAQIIYIMTPFIVAFALAYILYPLLKKLVSRKLKEALAVTIIVIGLLLIVALIIALVVPTLYEQTKSFINLASKFNDSSLENNILHFGKYKIDITDTLNELSKAISGSSKTIIQNIIGQITNFAGKFIVGFVSFIYFLSYMDNIREWIKKSLQKNKKILNYIKTLDKEISSYLRGLGTFMIFELLEYSLLYFLIGHPNWLILGLLACVTTIIPYFGGLITNIIALLLASVVSKRLLILTLIICLIFPQTDGYLVSPKIYNKTNNVNPLVTIMCVSIGGSLFGPIGIVIALPIYLLLKSTYNYYKKDIKEGMVIVKNKL